MESFRSFSQATSDNVEEHPLDELSERLQISQQTLVRWVDRHLIDGTLGWSLSDNNEEIRVLKLDPSRLEGIKKFADEYREGLVSRREARRILKVIDRKKVKKMVRAGRIETTTVDDETKMLVSSLEDYLISEERERLEDA